MPALPPPHHPPRSLLTSAGTLTHLVLVSSGAPNPWPRNSAVDHLATISSADAPAAAPSCIPTTKTGDRHLHTFNMPRVQYVAMGSKVGAVITTRSALYIVLFSPLGLTFDETQQV
ncbi:hypothetical protein EV356DRAFT_516408 [Viridothelium virens]|uniref:Uncharacterized protein n=1 Tax=Viridothelium virens TaxID=1048519 RepID=A0A6A6H622_VIRVR|nr:hypothetical protein EV356DRAFT_516408 [Viridothelium virens]